MKEKCHVLMSLLYSSMFKNKVNHNKLFTKLIDQGCPSFIVCMCGLLSIVYYSTQKFTIRSCRSFSECFTVSNGVQQSGTLSPDLFNMYMNDLSVNLIKLQIGCLYAGTIMNHVMYVDDLFSPRVSGFRKFTDCCAE